MPGRFQDPVLPETVNFSDHPSVICADLLQQYLVAQEGEWRKWAMKQGNTLALPVDTGEGKVATKYHLRLKRILGDIISLQCSKLGNESSTNAFATFGYLGHCI